jgi:divalent metal cation (Fe/Co/Zn/Cd) transporter
MTGRWTYRVSAAGVLVLAAAAFTLSYDALHQLAQDSRVRPGLAWLWPVVIDGTIVVALLTVLAAKRATARAGYP